MWSSCCQHAMLFTHVNTPCCSRMSTRHAVHTCQHAMLFTHVNTPCCSRVSTRHAVHACQHAMLFTRVNTPCCSHVLTRMITTRGNDNKQNHNLTKIKQKAIYHITRQTSADLEQGSQTQNACRAIIQFSDIKQAICY